jgi:UDP-glucose 4-epimerase
MAESPRQIDGNRPARPEANSLKKTRAVVLAGGKGTRLAPYTSVLPKPLMPVGEHSILEIVVEQLAGCGVEKVTFCVGYLSHLIHAVFRRRDNGHVKISYVHEEEALGTAAPLRLVKGLGKTFIVMNGDVLTTLDFRDLVRHHHECGNVLTIATHERAIKIDYGMLEVDAAASVRRFREKPEIVSAVSMGIYVMERSVLKYIPEGRHFDFPELVQALLAAGQPVGAYRYPGPWFDIGRHEDYEEAVAAWEANAGYATHGRPELDVRLKDLTHLAGSSRANGPAPVDRRPRARRRIPLPSRAQTTGPEVRKALVTGGAGFVGSHLSERLLADGWEVFALDDVSTGSLENVAHLSEDPRFHLVVESVLSTTVVSELVHKCDVVYHLAAAVGVRLIVEQPVHTLVTNVEGTKTVLEYCSRFRKRVLVASTSEVYGDHPEERPLVESARRIYGPTTARRWAYAGSKAMDEFLALAYQEQRGLDCVIARLFNTVGPRQSGQYGMVIPRFVARALAGERLEIHGDGTQTRCFCHVADTIRALTGLMDATEFSGEIFNVGSTEQISILELAERVREATGSHSELTFIPYDQVYGRGIEDMLHRIPAIDRIGEAIGWRPTRSLDGILRDVIGHGRRAVPVLLGESAAAP